MHLKLFFGLWLSLLALPIFALKASNGDAVRPEGTRVEDSRWSARAALEKQIQLYLSYSAIKNPEQRRDNMRIAAQAIAETLFDKSFTDGQHSLKENEDFLTDLAVSMEFPLRESTRAQELTLEDLEILIQALKAKDEKVEGTTSWAFRWYVTKKSALVAAAIFFLGHVIGVKLLKDIWAKGLIDFTVGSVRFSKSLFFFFLGLFSGSSYAKIAKGCRAGLSGLSSATAYLAKKSSDFGRSFKTPYRSMKRAIVGSFRAVWNLWKTTISFLGVNMAIWSRDAVERAIAWATGAGILYALYMHKRERWTFASEKTVEDRIVPFLENLKKEAVPLNASPLLLDNN